MFKYLFQIPLFSILLLSLPVTALAVDYTAKSNKSSEQKSAKNKEQCTKDDLRKIKSFDRKANAKIKELNYLNDYKSKPKNKGKAMDLKKEMKEIVKFFKSKKFNKMKIIYKRCGKRIPQPSAERPYWSDMD